VSLLHLPGYGGQAGFGCQELQVLDDEISQLPVKGAALSYK